MGWITLDSPLWVTALILGTVAIGILLWEIWLEAAAARDARRMNEDLWRAHQEVYDPQDENMGDT